MTIEAAILENIEKLPDSVKQAVLLYTDFLASQYAEIKPNETEELPKKKRGGFGILKGKIWMADDFDGPLEDFKEYM